MQNVNVTVGSENAMFSFPTELTAREECLFLINTLHIGSDALAGVPDDGLNAVALSRTPPSLRTKGGRAVGDSQLKNAAPEDATAMQTVADPSIT